MLVNLSPLPSTSTGRRRSSPSLMRSWAAVHVVSSWDVRLSTWRGINAVTRVACCPCCLPMLLCSVSFLVAAVFFTIQLIVTYETNPIIVFGLVRLNFGDFFKYCPVSTTRGHPYKLYTSHCTSIRSRFFAHRVIKAWNSLPPSTNFSSLAAFKRSILQTDLSKHLTMLFVWCWGFC